MSLLPLEVGTIEKQYLVVSEHFTMQVVVRPILPVVLLIQELQCLSQLISPSSRLLVLTQNLVSLFDRLSEPPLGWSSHCSQCRMIDGIFAQKSLPFNKLLL